MSSNLLNNEMVNLMKSACMNNDIVLITGQAGAGKTTMLHHLLNEEQIIDHKQKYMTESKYELSDKDYELIKSSKMFAIDEAQMLSMKELSLVLSLSSAYGSTCALVCQQVLEEHMESIQLMAKHHDKKVINIHIKSFNEASLRVF